MNQVISKTSGVTWYPVIGLEVHCQLRTGTKLFCGCVNRFGAEPNTQVCPVCSGQPGALPVMNKEALQLALRAALALGCDIAPWSKFDRKNYFYCDLPKGYQISQFDKPYCTGGGLELSSGKRIRLNRIHMEDDAGKAIHDRGPDTLVDLNRAGIPLIESVTEPDLESADEAFEYLTALKEILQYVGASDCDMEKGSLRCDVNISVRQENEELRTKVELKNLNSFRNVKAAIDFEIERQIAAWENPDSSAHPVQETRLFDPGPGVTRTMRAKEDAHDYRYFPDPDLPQIFVTDALLDEVRSSLPELPSARRARYAEEFELSDYDARVLASEREVADFFEACVQVGAPAKESSNWITNELLGVRNERGPETKLIDLGVTPTGLSEMIELIAAGTLGKSAARKVLRAMIENGSSAAAMMAELGLEQVQDTAQLESWCRAALEGQDQAIADIREGKLKAVGALIGKVMQASQGKANPGQARELLMKLIEAHG
ncbi:MAG: aspartyl-tRNA(Asn)/glutamyl-tRNA(Gln) amidotransferase subunit B [Planctomycetota bacterium]|jgi:aspartyl-tRNA(Asn)/glutamyl-tRNA(Gln) amidotransferase subunit B